MARETLLDLYKKEVKRLERNVKTMKRRGYMFAENSVPSIPKRVRRSQLNKIQRMTTKDLYKKATFYDPIENEIVSGDEMQRRIRSRASKKGHETRNKNKEKQKTDSTETQAGEPPNEVDDVLRYVQELIETWTPNPLWSEWFVEIKRNDKDTLDTVLGGGISQLSERIVAKNLEANAYEVKDLAWKICYGSSGDKKDMDALADLAQFTSIMYGRVLTPEEAKNIQDIHDAQVYEN